jgi:hypothetical protein
MFRGRFIICIVLLAVALASARSAAQSPARVAAAAYDFGRVAKGASVEHEFELLNEGDTPLRVVRARMTPPLVAIAMPSVIAPGEHGTLRIRLDTSSVQGLFEGVIVLSVSDARESTVSLQFQGFVVPPVEWIPGPALYLSAVRGERKEQSIEAVNHQSTPLRIVDLVHSSKQFTTKLETIEDGMRYRLTIISRPDAVPGRQSDSITVKTSGEGASNVAVLANTFVHERVYTFPETVDLGALPLAQLRAHPELLKALTQRLMVYGPATGKFTASAHAENPMLEIGSQRGPAGDRWQITVALKAEQLRAGPIASEIVIDTNDAEFPKLIVLVSGAILP